MKTNLVGRIFLWFLWALALYFVAFLTIPMDAATLFLHNDYSDSYEYGTRLRYAAAPEDAIRLSLGSGTKSMVVQIPDGVMSYVDNFYRAPGDGSPSVWGHFVGPWTLQPNTVVDCSMSADGSGTHVWIYDAGPAPSSGGGSSSDAAPTTDQLDTFLAGFYLSVGIGLIAFMLAVVRMMGRQNHNPS